MKRFWAFVVAGTLIAAGVGLAWLNRPLTMPSETLEVSIEPGTSTRAVSKLLVQSGLEVSPALLLAWFRLSGQAQRIKAGNYELNRGVTPLSLLEKLVRGEESQAALTFAEGWTFRQWRAALFAADFLRRDTAQWSDAEIMARLGRAGIHPEGRFFPDTYFYSKGSSDLALLRRAMHAMDHQLAQAWAQREAGLPLQSADDALTLASIIEKETGHPADRAAVAGVFVNRLRTGMLLQTDPTVIYGMGESYDGTLYKRNLQTDTPYNTYLRPGLPPTPIAMPGRAALLASVQPAHGTALYFVAKGNGRSHFSATLDEHNQAVNRYLRRRAATVEP